MPTEPAEPTTEAAEPTEAAVYDLVHRELIDFGVEAETVTADAKFDNLDIDSLDAAELMTSIKRQFNVEVPRSELSELTIQDLVARVVATARV